MNEPLSIGGKVHTVECDSPEPHLLTELMEDAGIVVDRACGGIGTCGKCRVQILSGECNPAGPEETSLLSLADIDGGIRLACYCEVLGKVSLRVEQADPDIKVLHSGICDEVQLEPVLYKTLLPPQRADQAGSLYEQMVRHSGVSADPSSLTRLLRVLGDNAGTENLTAVVRDNELIGLEMGDATKHHYGLAVDIGTTTVVADLLDLIDGRRLGTASALNPQTRYGLDVLSRIAYAGQHPHGLKALHDAIIQCLNDLIGQLCNQSGAEARHIYQVAVAANTVMLHLLLAVNPQTIGRAPYHPVFRQGQVIAPAMLGINSSPFAQLYCLPSVSGFVGADIVGGMAAVGLDRASETVLFLDLGTNGEMVLYHDGKLLACSTAAGPALEGMNIACGMRAAPGAVEAVVLHGDIMRWRTIGNAPPLGLCGSGLLDLVAAMLDIGVITPAGRLVEKGRFLELHTQSRLAGQITEEAGKRRFWLVPPDSSCQGVFISQADVRQVQVAKSAIVTGIKTLLAQTGLEEQAVNRVYLAGAFGAYLQPASLIRLGFFPEAWRNRIAFVGNTAQSGAIMALLSWSARLRMEEIAQKVDYLQLESCPDFQKLFVGQMGFPSGCERY